MLAAIQWILRYKIERGPQLEATTKALFDICYQKLAHCKTKSMEILILQEMLSLMNSHQDEEAIEWLKHSEIKLLNGKTIHLEKPQRYQLIKLIFRSTKYSN